METKEVIQDIPEKKAIEKNISNQIDIVSNKVESIHENNKPILKKAEELLVSGEINQEQHKELSTFLSQTIISAYTLKNLDLENFIQLYLSCVDKERFKGILDSTVKAKLTKIINNLEPKKLGEIIGILNGSKFEFIVNSIDNNNFIEIITTDKKFGDFLVFITKHSTLKIKEFVENEHIRNFYLKNNYTAENIIRHKKNILKKGKIPWYVIQK